MKIWNLSNGYKIFQVLKGRNNAYLIHTDCGNILIDTGIKNNKFSLHRNLGLTDIINQKIDFLILTHSHFDHCGNAAHLKNFFNCKIIQSRKEAINARNGYLPISKGINIFTNLLTVLANRIGKIAYGFHAFDADILTDDYLNLKEYGFDIEIISTPGHTSGSISVIVNHEIAFVGDTMMKVLHNTIIPPFVDDRDLLIKSWGRLLQTECQIFLPGHSSEINRELLIMDYEKYTKQ